MNPKYSDCVLQYPSPLQNSQSISGLIFSQDGGGGGGGGGGGDRFDWHGSVWSAKEEKIGLNNVKYQYISCSVVSRFNYHKCIYHKPGFVRFLKQVWL